MKAKTRNVGLRAVALISLISFTVAGTSCMTTYDSYGRPVQSVDPGAAVAGAAAAGVLGYAIGRDNDRDHHHHHGGYYRPRYHRGYYR